MTKDIKKALGESVGDAEKSGGGAGKGFVSGLGKTVAKVAAVLGIGAVIGKTISLGMARAVAIEGAQKKLEGLGHSAKSITSIMGSALASVKGTAYGLGDAASVAAMMSAAGVRNGKEMTTVLKTVADVAAISGRSLTDVGTIFGSVAARGKLQGDDMLQLMSSGIPVLQLLGKHLGKTSADVSAMVSKGQIDFATFEAAMRAGLGGAALKSGETFTGAVANVRAALGRLGAAFMAPGIEAAKPLLAGITAVIDRMTSAVGPLAAAMSEKLQPAAVKIGAALTAMANGKSLSDILGDVGPIAGIVSAVSPLGVALKALAPVLPQIGAAFAQVLTALAPAVPALAEVAAIIGGALAQALAVAVPVILPLVVQLAQLAGQLLANKPLVMGLVAAFAGFKAVLAAKVAIAGITTAITATKAALTGGLVLVQGFAAGLRGIAAVQASAAALRAFNAGLAVQKVGLAVATAAQWLWNAALSANPLGLIVVAIAAVTAALVWFFTQTEVGRAAWQGFTDWLVGAWQGIVAFATSAWQGLGEFFTGLWASITAGAQAGWAAFQGVLSAVWGVIEPIVTGPLKVWQALFQAVWDTITVAASAAFLILTGLFTGNFALIGQAVSGFWAQIQQIWSTAWSTIVAAVQAGWSRITGLFSAAGAAIMAVASRAWNAIRSAFSAGVSAAVTFVSQLPGKAASALASLGSRIVSIATSAWNSFRGAVTTGVSNAVTVVRGLPGKAVAALAGIGGRLVGAGRDLIQGFINGIGEAAGRVAGAVQNMANNAIDAAKRALGIASPSKVFKSLGKFVTAGLAAGIATTASAATTAVNKVVTEVNRVAARATGKAEKKRAKAAAAAVANMLKVQNRLTGATKRSAMTLADIGKAREKLADRIKDQNKVLADLVEESNRMRDQVADRVMGSFDLAGFAKAGKASFAAINAGLQTALDKAKRYNTLLTGLKGVPADVVALIGQMGVDEGIAIAEAFANASAVDRAEFVKNWQALAKTSTQVGQTVADKMYKVGIDAQKGLIAGLQSQDKALVKAADKLVASLVKAVKKKLGIKSPSRVFRMLAEYSGKGFTTGLEAQEDAARRAGREFAAAAVPTRLDPWDQALADLRARITPDPVYMEPPASLRRLQPVTDRAAELRAALDGLAVDIDNGRLFFARHYQPYQDDLDLDSHLGGDD